MVALRGLLSTDNITWANIQPRLFHTSVSSRQKLGQNIYMNTHNIHLSASPDALTAPQYPVLYLDGTDTKPYY